MNALPPLTPARSADVSHLLDRVHHVDALDLLRALPDASVDAVITDPPYGNDNGQDDLAGARARDKVKGGRKRGNIERIDNDDTEAWRALMNAFLPEVARVLKPEGAFCCCNMGGGGGGGVIYFAELAIWIDQYMTFFNTVVWDKSRRGDGMGWRYRRNYEFVFVAHKRGGRCKWNPDRKARPNIVRYPPTRNENHPTEKPLLLMEEFVLNHTLPGDIVVDPFCGSGTTLVAAQQNKRHYIGADILAKHVTKSRQRCAFDKPQLLFTEAV